MSLTTSLTTCYEYDSETDEKMGETNSKSSKRVPQVPVFDTAKRGTNVRF
jgi:hypothetical protein